MPEKKPRAKKKAASKPAKASIAQQPTLLTLFGKRSSSSDVVDVSSETDGEGKSGEESIVDVCGSSPSPPPTQQTRKGKRARQPEREPSPPLSVPSSPLSTPPSTPPPSRTIDSSTSTDVYGSLRRSSARSIVTTNDEPTRKTKNRPLFAAVRKNKTRPGLNDFSPMGSQEMIEGSQGVPIEIGEDDEPEPVVPLTSAAVHAFFKPRKGKEKATSSTSTSAVTVGPKTAKVQRHGDGLDAPWPSSESVHVGMEQGERLEPRSCRIPRRTTPVASSSAIPDERIAAWAKAHADDPDDVLNLSPGRFDAWAELRKEASQPDEEIPEEHVAHPAIARLQGPDGARHAFAPPGRACEILGNEEFAQQMVDWLKLLELRRSKGEDIQPATSGKPRERRVIVTQVDRRKRRKVENQNEYDQSFVVDDLEDDLPDNVEMLVELGNTFVLSGPPGSGKSAAVHACAQELGWSVFEVYAGIGRRGGGANGLASLIGSVGANHTVGGSGDGEVQQSLILLDEVDLVFEQDTQFWSTVVGLVRESRRPVVMTCNDLSCVPPDDLPVHRYFEFQAADPELAGSYLYAQARAAGCARLPSRDAFRALFSATAQAPRVPDYAIPDAPQHPLQSQLDRSPDLRRALEDLKFWHVHGQGGGTYTEHTPRDVREAWTACGRDVMEYVGDWSAEEVVRASSAKPKRALEQLWQFADSVSMVDAGLERRWARQMQAGEVDRFAPGEDDEVRTGQLCKPAVSYEQVGVAEFCWDADMALESICAARRVLERGGAGRYARAGLVERRGWDSRRLEEVRSEHQEKLTTFLDAGLVSPSTPLLPRPALVLDMIPAVRAMVAADDEMVASAARVVRGRNVRSSARVAAAGRVREHERYIGLNSQELAAVRATEYVASV